jgi:hypothetical protein
MPYRNENESYRPRQSRSDERRRDRDLRGDDTYYGGARSQREDWPTRGFDNNAYDRREGMYGAGGHDFADRMRDAYGYGIGDEEWYGRGSSSRGRAGSADRDDRSWWSSHSPMSGDRPWYEEAGRPNFTGGDRGWGERHLGRDRSRSGFLQEVKSFFGVGPKGYKRSDERIREDVSEALYRHPEVDASNIEVRVKDGVVTLSGTVSNRWMKRQAEDAVEYVPGVQDVRVDLTVPREASDVAEVPGTRGTQTGAGRQGSGRKVQ